MNSIALGTRTISDIVDEFNSKRNCDCALNKGQCESLVTLYKKITKARFLVEDLKNYISEHHDLNITGSKDKLREIALTGIPRYYSSF